MSEIRQDGATKRWVIIATDRAKRPSDMAAAPSADQRERASDCPFCPGNEHMTPPEVLAYRDGDGPPNSPGWSVRVVPNRFPALSPAGEVEVRDPHWFTNVTGVGAHEVLIETPLHNAGPAELGEEGAAQVLAAAFERFDALKQDPRLRYIAFFRNHGLPAGSSLTHPHTQIIATPVAPTNVRQEIEEARRYCDDRMNCVYCETIEQEMAAGERVVLETEHFLAFEPYASRWPFETWLLPRKHTPVLDASAAGYLQPLAEALQATLKALYDALGDPAYNLVLHEAPLRDSCEDYYHWHIEILPRLATAAGFELGTGIWINTVLPEQAASYLREFI